MIRAFFGFVCLALTLGACTQRMICPAYQSAFIYDKDALRKKFSYFQEDSTPKILTASKNKYLIAESVSYRKKLSSLQTIEMRAIHPVIPDSLTEEGDISMAELDLAARSVIDSTYIVDVETEPVDSVMSEDSVYVISKDKEVRMLRYNRDSISYKVDEVRFNTDQDNYMWYLRNSLVLPDVRIAQNGGQAEREGAGAEKKKGIKGFFQNLFKKKNKREEEVPVDSLNAEPEEERSEFDFNYEDLNSDSVNTADVREEEPTEKKKGLFSFLKKGDKEAKKKKKARLQKEKLKEEEEPGRQRKLTNEEDENADKEILPQGDEGF